MRDNHIEGKYSNVNDFVKINMTTIRLSQLQRENAYRKKHGINHIHFKIHTHTKQPFILRKGTL